MCCATGLSGHSHRRCRQTGQICVLAVYEDPRSWVAGQTGRQARGQVPKLLLAGSGRGNTKGPAGRQTGRPRAAAACHSARMARAALPGRGKATSAEYRAADFVNIDEFRLQRGTY
ncbi:unnamed protein product [Calypogeia fissa]